MSRRFSKLQRLSFRHLPFRFTLLLIVFYFFIFYFGELGIYDITVIFLAVGLRARFARLVGLASFSGVHFF